MVSTCLLVAAAVGQVAEPILAAGLSLQLPVMLLHLVGGVVGYWLSRALGFGETTSRTMAIETSMKSSAFGFLLAKLHFGAFAARVPSAVSVVWMALTGSSMARRPRGRRRRRRRGRGRGDAAAATWMFRGRVDAAGPNVAETSRRVYLDRDVFGFRAGGRVALHARQARQVRPVRQGALREGRPALEPQEVLRQEEGRVRGPSFGDGRKYSNVARRFSCQPERELPPRFDVGL